ncbi:MAG: hypothetical protein LBD78_09605 [Spirochaetaceae bacterium]|jgi:hypothetical protein|nr:hypothetical protein [Spirochaetaceae bacterium]
MRFPRFSLFSLFLIAGIRFCFGGPAELSAQEDEIDPASRIGLTLEELIVRSGPPESVYAVRGGQDWQDDVVFVYPDGDYYIYRDRVWQLGLQSVYGINVGDRETLISLILEDTIQRFEGYTLYSLPGRAWPLSIRFNVDGNGLITHIFIYRPDF